MKFKTDENLSVGIARLLQRVLKLSAKICVYAIVLFSATDLLAGDFTAAQVLDVFPQSAMQLPVLRQGETVFSSRYTPSDSLWAEGLDESQVFQTEMIHKQGRDNSFALRVGKLLQRDAILNDHGIANVRKTGGWNLSCASKATDSPSLALVFGRDKHLETERRRMTTGEPYCQTGASLYRDWRASAPLYEKAWKDWRTRPANSFRNYDVAEVIPKLRILPGTTIWYRSFLVVGCKSRVIELARSLVDKVDYGLVQFDPKTTAMTALDGHARDVDAGQSEHQRKNAPMIYTRPVTGTKPLFLIQNTQTRRSIITTDPYYFVKKRKVDFLIPQNHPHHNAMLHRTVPAMDVKDLRKALKRRDKW